MVNSIDCVLQQTLSIPLHCMNDYVSVAPTPATACIDIEDGANAANEAAAAAAAAAEDDVAELPMMTPELPRWDDNDDDVCSFILDDSRALPPLLPGMTTEGYKFGTPFGLMELLF